MSEGRPVLTRVLAGVVGLGIVVPALVWGGQLGAEIVVGIVVLIALDEWSRMAVPDRHWGALAVLVAGGLPVYLQLQYGPPAWHIAVLSAAALGALVWSMVALPDTDRGATVAARLLAGLVYIPVLFSFVPWVRRFDHGITWIFMVLAITWLGDTGAFFAGRAFGAHKLFERVSPKKTWEGAAGGVLAAVAGACIVKAIGLPDLPWLHAVVLGVLVDAVGILGDLAESMFKRSFGVKDSGWIMPGHGGILDRTDSLLFTMPVAWMYATAVGLA